MKPEITKKELTEMIESSVDKKIDHNLMQIQRDLSEIKRVIIGDPSFNEKGLKVEHDEMYSYCRKIIDEDIFGKVEKHDRLVDNFKFLFTFIGASSVASTAGLILGIISLIKSLGVI